MSARRDDLIRLAAETLGCVGQTAHGHWIYRCAKTGLWMVRTDSMIRLGMLVSQSPILAYETWCDGADPATEIDVDAIVRDHDITAETNLDELMAWESTGHLTVHLLLRFYREDVIDTVRINEEIDRDREWQVEDDLGMHEPADDCEADR
jgi:hypothetical protein